jgi:anti-sigma B factor antagonist
MEGRFTVIGRIRGESQVPPPLECVVALKDDTAWVRLVGELDLASVGGVEARLSDVARERPRELVLDLAELSFIDSSGLRLLAKWMKTTENADIAFSIVAPKPPVRRVFSITGLDALLPFRPTEDGG